MKTNMQSDGAASFELENESQGYSLYYKPLKKLICSIIILALVFFVPNMYADQKCIETCNLNSALELAKVTSIYAIAVVGCLFTTILYPACVANFTAVFLAAAALIAIENRFCIWNCKKE